MAANPKNADALFGLGMVEQAEGRLEPAADHLNQALHANQEKTDAYWQLLIPA